MVTTPNRSGPLQAPRQGPSCPRECRDILPFLLACTYQAGELSLLLQNGVLNLTLKRWVLFIRMIAKLLIARTMTVQTGL